MSPYPGIVARKPISTKLVWCRPYLAALRAGKPKQIAGECYVDRYAGGLVVGGATTVLATIDRPQGLFVTSLSTRLYDSVVPDLSIRAAPVDFELPMTLDLRVERIRPTEVEVRPVVTWRGGEAEMDTLKVSVRPGSFAELLAFDQNVRLSLSVDSPMEVAVESLAAPSGVVAGEWIVASKRGLEVVPAPGGGRATWAPK